MASAQVLRKQEHLEAGKRKLEEFRRKKAAEKAKKAASTGQPGSSDGVLNEKQPSETKHGYVTNVNSLGTSDALADNHGRITDVASNIVNKESDISLKSAFSSSTNWNAKPSLFASNNDTSSSVQDQSYLKNEDHKEDAASIGLDGLRSAKDKISSGTDDDGSSAQVSFEVGNDHSLDHHKSSIEESRPSGHSNYPELYTYPSNNTYGPEKDLSRGNSGTSAVFTNDILPQNSASNALSDKFRNSSLGDDRLTFSSYPDGQDTKFSGAVDHAGSMNHSSPWTSDSKYSDSDSDARSSSNHAPSSPPPAGRRSRPSFLDSIHIPKGPSSSPSLFEAAKFDSSSSKIYPVDGLGSTVSRRSPDSLVASGDGVELSNHVKHDFFSRKQNEGFAALEQHIEDLTQEKFSLQRALEASRALAESLASENSALTDSFNQQGSVVNRLKLDLETLQEEIKAHLAELEAAKIEYANAQMECNAADERAKLLASEVIELEEKALRLRSTELKLERQLENAQAEVSSYRKKMSSLEKDCQDLLSTINALQEEKKLLQSKLRKISSSEKSIDFNQASYTKKDVATSTNDLDTTTMTESADSENFAHYLHGDGASSSQFSHENINFSLEGQPMAFPSDQIRIIQNINALLAELALEKDQLMQALSAESSQRSKLLELNKELTRKLEAQTQRLELLTAQSKANDNIQPRQVDSHAMQESLTYADEGDEVVERVLNWIMKLFPGGPSRRRPTKHL